MLTRKPTEWEISGEASEIIFCFFLVKVRREYLEGEFKTIEKTLASLNECIDKLQGFALKAQAKMSRVAGSK